MDNGQWGTSDLIKQFGNLGNCPLDHFGNLGNLLHLFFHTTNSLLYHKNPQVVKYQIA
jgi:hypothetical protein